jgi:hypothetical protein
MVLDPFHRLTVWNIDERQPNIQQARRCRCLQYKHKGPSTNVKQFFKHLQNLIHGTTWEQEQQIRQNYSVGMVYFFDSDKVKLSLYGPWRPLGLREVEAPTFSDIRLTDGGKVVSPTSRPLLSPGIFLVLIFVRG